MSVVTESIRRGWQALAQFAHDPKAQERFWRYVDKRGSDECWPWQGSRSPKGYGHMAYAGGLRRASRLAWALANGRSPDALNVCHTCDNPPCLNPAHLFAGTDFDNMQDMVRKGRHVPVNRIEALVPRMRGEKSNFARLKEAEVLVIRERRLRGDGIGVIARDYGVDPRTVAKIVTRRTWAHV